jgi:hypothetical protein
MAPLISELADFFKDLGHNLKVTFRKLSKKHAPWRHMNFIPPRREHKK